MYILKYTASPLSSPKSDILSSVWKESPPFLKKYTNFSVLKDLIFLKRRKAFFKTKNQNSSQMKQLFTHIFLIAALAIFFINGFAQSGEKCGTDLLLQAALDQDPTLAEKMAKNEAKLQQFIQETEEKGGIPENEVITIPVVVHVVYNTPVQNISDQIIASQMGILNQDYRKLNADTTLIPEYFADIAADTRIEFCLATRDPEGNPTNGITRTETDITSFDFAWGDFEEARRIHRTAVGGKDGWPRDQYLNIWVCNLPPLSVNSTLAYAYLPGAFGEVDGIVCRYNYFGSPSIAGEPYNLGRTMVHEVGHWLNLYHVFNNAGTAACSDDFVEDTPPQADNNFGCPTFPSSTCGNYSDMFMNYMDYADDACTTMFSRDQVKRMRAAIYTFRSSLLTSLGCSPVPVDDVRVEAISDPGANYCWGEYIPITAVIKNVGSSTLTSAEVHYQIDGTGASGMTAWTGSLEPNESASVFLDAPLVPSGLYPLTVFTALPNGVADVITHTDTLTTYFSAFKGLDAPYFQDFEDAYIDQGWSIKNANDMVPWQQLDYVLQSNGTVGKTMGLNHDFNRFFEEEGTTDELIAPTINLANLTSPYLAFDVSYFYQLGQDDGLKVLVSVDCGFSFTEVYHKIGDDLGTRDTETPDVAEDWVHEMIDLSEFEGESILLKFNTKSDGGNWIMLDNVEVGGVAVGIESAESEVFTFSATRPTSSHQLLLNIQSPISQNVTVTVFNINGQQVHGLETRVQNGLNTLTIDSNNWASGMYLVQVRGENGLLVEKVYF